VRVSGTPVQRESRAAIGWAVATGVVLGVAYAFSPLTVLVLGSLPFVWRWASRGLSEHERRWLGIILAVAVVARLAAVAGLFLSAPHSVPYANFFGDEELFKRRSVWIRNIGLGVPISPADMIYAFDDVGKSVHLYVLAFVQAIVGNAPYGLLLLNAAIYAAGAIALYRLVRPAYGGVAALAALTLLLFLPSLFTWSISALKEPPFMSVGAIEVVAAAAVVRGPELWRRLAGLAVTAACAYMLEALRVGGLAMAAIGVGLGVTTALIVSRPRVWLGAIVAVPLAVMLAAATPTVQLRWWQAIHRVAYMHWGQVATPGYTYQLLDERFYEFRERVETMTPAEAERYLVRAAVDYVVVPLPWDAESRATLAYLPEQMVWYVLVVLAPVGIWIGLRRDSTVTCLLAAHALAAAAIVAVTGGNIGTLVRHRGLALPYLVWLSTLGGVELLRFTLGHRTLRVDAVPSNAGLNHANCR
jgi:hypothetical protein